MRHESRLNAGMREHALTGVDAEDFQAGKTYRGRPQKVAVSNARDQQAFAVLKGIEMGDTCTLKTPARDNAFHPSIVRRQDVEGHEGRSSEKVAGTMSGSERTRTKHRQEICRS